MQGHESVKGDIIFLHFFQLSMNHIFDHFDILFIQLIFEDSLL